MGFWKVFIGFVLVVGILPGCTGLQPEQVEKVEYSWEVHSVFEDDNFTFFGEEGRIGVCKLSGDFRVPFIAGEEALYFWRFYGESSEAFRGDLKLIGFNKKVQEEVTLLEVENRPPDIVAFPNKGVQLQMKMALPSKGLWNIKAYFGEKWAGTVVIDVQ